MSRDCGGQGLCGKCRVQTPDLPVLEADRGIRCVRGDGAWAASMR